MAHIKVTYEVVTPESAEDNAVAERGYVKEHSGELQPDEDEGETLVDLAVKTLQDAGATEASSSYFHPGRKQARLEGLTGGIWYTAQGSPDQHTMAEESHSYHLVGFTEAEEREIYDRIKGRT
jgi:hypothetical protein